MQKFNYHQHTYRCMHADLDMEDEDYIQEYIKMGFEKVAFTDHCPEKNKVDKREHMRMPYLQKEEYLSSIKKLKEKYSNKIEIQTGYEAEYLPGEEENLKELKEETDKIILGQHFVYGNNGNLKMFWEGNNSTPNEVKRYADYVEKAMELGIPDIIAHPDLFLSGQEKFGEVEAQATHKICKAAEKYNVLLEINLNNIFAHTYYENRTLNHEPIDVQRKKLHVVKYPSKDFWNIAKDYDIKVVYGIDAHHRGQILLWNELLELAKDVLGEDIINKLNFTE